MIDLGTGKKAADTVAEYSVEVTKTAKALLNSLDKYRFAFYQKRGDDHLSARRVDIDEAITAIKDVLEATEEDLLNV